MSDYCPGAVQVPQSGGGGLDTSLPPHAIWHITWDALKPDGSQPQFSAVANYLKNQGYCPHLMWNPFTGYIEQYYPASQSARALAAWNGDGKVNVQIEVFFTPGCVVDGKKYMTVAETPLNGLDTILEWLDGLGVPRTWPLGSPQWTGNSRDSNTWNTKGGHYGHCNVPDNTHTDPGPMPDITGINYASISTQALEEIDVAAEQNIMARLDQIVSFFNDKTDRDRNMLAGFVRDVVNAKETLTPEQLDAKFQALTANQPTNGEQLFKGDASPEVYAWDGSGGFRHIEQAEYLTLISAGGVLRELPQALISGAVKSNG